MQFDALPSLGRFQCKMVQLPKHAPLITAVGVVSMDDAEHWIEMRLGAPLPMSRKLRVGDDFLDQVEMTYNWIAEPSGYLLPSLRLGLVYEDDLGNRSERTVRAERIHSNEEGIRLYCFCEMRQAPRTFLGRSIIEIIDWRTGEVRQEGQSYLSELWEVAAKSDDAAWQLVTSGVTILSAVALVDKVIFRDEVELILGFADRVLMRAGKHLSTAEIIQLERMILSSCPTIRTLRSAFGIVANDRHAVRHLKSVARSIIELDEVLTAEETRLIAWLDQNLKG